MSYQTILLHVNSRHLSSKPVEFAAGVTAQYVALSLKLFQPDQSGRRSCVCKDHYSR